MSNNFNEYIEGINASFWKDLCLNRGCLRMYLKGEEFVSVYRVARYIGYVKSGTLKYVAYGEDGSEHVVGLEFAGEFVADFPFSLYGQKSRVSIIAVTDCEIYCVEAAYVKKMMDTNPHVKEIVMRSSEAIFSTVYDRYVSLYVKSPQERYRDLISRYPDLFNMFPLREIASFLNVTPTHLSRLRHLT